MMEERKGTLRSRRIDERIEEVQTFRENFQSKKKYTENLYNFFSTKVKGPLKGKTRGKTSYIINKGFIIKNGTKTSSMNP